MATQLERYQRLIELSRDLASTLDLNQLLVRILDAAADLCEAQEASILLYDHLKGELNFEAATNMDNTLMRGFSVPMNSIAGWIVTNRKGVILNDAQNDSRLYNQVGVTINLSTRSLLGVPLQTKDKVIGALEAINKMSGEFTAEDLDLLAALGGQAAVAIENSRLFQQSDLISEFVHELRTPMASLNTAAHLMGRQGITEEQRNKMVEMVRSETNRLTELASTFLDLARLESGRAQFKSELGELQPILTNSIDIMNSRAAEHNITIESHVQPNLPKINLDRDKFKQVMLNLLSNAIKYNFPGGKVLVKAALNDPGIVLSVSDTGPGISEEALQHMFEKFYRVPGTEKLASGTGLGLSISKRIVEAHRGRIEVTSEVGKGTTFTVYLPLPK
jgi:signal transduction histidine kinase